MGSSTDAAGPLPSDPRTDTRKGQEEPEIRASVEAARRKLRLLTVALAALAASAAFVLPSWAGPGDAGEQIFVSDAQSAFECDADCRADLERARQATEKYRDVAAATLDGFVETMGCASTAAGGVGIRYVNPQRYDQNLEVTQPEFLLYMPEGFDSLSRRLVAVGYAVPAALGSPGPVPVLFGQPFTGPVAGQAPLEPSHYELVVWLFSENRDGTFAGANPVEACDASSVRASADAGSAEGCYEVLGLFSVPAPDGAERVRRLGRIPDEFRLRGEQGGSAQLMLSTFHCEKVTVGGTGTETMFAELVALLDPPDYVGDDPCCSRYLLQEVWNNPDVVQWKHERGGLGPDAVAYSPELVRRFDPPLCTADPDYSFTTPDFELRAATACHGPVDAPTSVRFWHEGSGEMTKLHFWAPIRFAAADVQVTARPGTLLAELLGTSEPVAADPGSLSVSWERGVLQIERTTSIPTAVTVHSFAAHRAAGGVVVRWQTASDVDVAGFNLYRERLGRRVKLNRSLIRTAPGRVHYSWRDRRAGRSPRHFLEEVRLHGGRVWHGPATAA